MLRAIGNSNRKGYFLELIFQQEVHHLLSFQCQNLGYILHLQHQQILAHYTPFYHQIRSVAQSCPTLCDPIVAARQASLSITNSRISLRLTSIESMMPSSHLILCRPLLLLPSIFASIRVFSNELALHIRWPNYRGFTFSILPMNIQG